MNKDSSLEETSSRTKEFWWKIRFFIPTSSSVSGRKSFALNFHWTGKRLWSAISKLEQFLPFIDNWEVCDIFSPKILKRYPQETYQQIKIWIKSSHCYTVRYAIGLLLSNFLDQEFKPEMLDPVAKIKSEEYYIQMMQARYFATALAKQYEATIPLIESKILEPFVQNKTIQKARESRRISAETKEYLVQFKK